MIVEVLFMVRFLTNLALVFLLTAVGAAAQVEDRFNIGGGAGFSVPTDNAGKNLDTGWNLGLRGGYNLTPHLSADLDFAYLGGRRMKIFSEARYQRMFTTRGSDLSYVPVTFGLRW
jgi:hypothetical protein